MKSPLKHERVDNNNNNINFLYSASNYIAHLIVEHNICALFNVYTIICGQANSPVDHSASLLLGAFARIPLSSHPGGVWLEAEHVVHTRQEIRHFDALNIFIVLFLVDQVVLDCAKAAFLSIHQNSVINILSIHCSARSESGLHKTCLSGKYQKHFS